ncbi:hypothetical protein N9C31_00875 [Gammaproteobacteria bacterium]|nr:hypothetical protein [Gammaproteobacteria bacterium]
MARTFNYQHGGKTYEISHAKCAQILAEKHGGSGFLKEFKLGRGGARSSQGPRAKWALHYERNLHYLFLGSLFLITMPLPILVLVAEPLAAFMLFSLVSVLLFELAKVFSSAAWRGATPASQSERAIIEQYIQSQYPHRFFSQDQLEAIVTNHLNQAGLLGKLMKLMSHPRGLSFLYMGLKATAILAGSVSVMSLVGFMSLSPLFTLGCAGLSMLSWVSADFTGDTVTITSNGGQGGQAGAPLPIPVAVPFDVYAGVDLPSVPGYSFVR